MEFGVKAKRMAIYSKAGGDCGDGVMPRCSGNI